MIDSLRRNIRNGLYSLTFAGLALLFGCGSEPDSPAELTYEPAPDAKFVTNEPLGSVVTYEPEADTND